MLGGKNKRRQLFFAPFVFERPGREKQKSVIVLITVLSCLIGTMFSCEEEGVILNLARRSFRRKGGPNLFLIYFGLGLIFSIWTI